MYVLVRKDLDPTYRCVQGTHAVAEYILYYPELAEKWGNSTLVFLGVRFPKGLREWHDKLEGAQKKFVAFFEPDQDEQITAIACLDDGRIFKDLRTV